MRTGRATDFFHDHIDPFLWQEGEQQTLGGIKVAIDRALGGQAGYEIDNQIIEHVWRDAAQLRHGDGDLLDLDVIKARPDRAAIFVTQGKQHDGSFLGAVQFAFFIV